jgi:hypothetical protein
VAELEFYKHWITVRPIPGTPLADLVDLSLFGPFRPGMTHDDGMARFGRPSNIHTVKYDTYYEYRVSSGRVELGRETYSTGEGTDSHWALYPYPDDRTVDAVLIPQIAKHINPDSPRTGIQIVFEGRRLENLAALLFRVVTSLDAAPLRLSTRYVDSRCKLGRGHPGDTTRQP